LSYGRIVFSLFKKRAVYLFFFDKYTALYIS